MFYKNMKHVCQGSIFQYSFACILSIFFFDVVTHLFSFKFTIPYYYAGDAIFGQSWIKTIVDTGWYLTNPYLGAPNGYNLADYPMSDNFHFLVIKLLSYITSNYAVITNTFYLLTFPTITLAAVFVFKRFGLVYPFALAASLLFAFQPYHFLRGEAHPFLSSYFIVPLAIWLAVLIATGEIERVGKYNTYTQWGLYLTLCILIGSSGIYYAFFSVFFLIICGILGSIAQKRWQLIGKACLFVFIISATVIINVMPTIIHRAEYGTNLEIANRHPLESEAYGFKITPMLLPISNDRIPFFSQLRYQYDTTTIAPSNALGSGIIASLGFLILLATLLFRTKINNDGDRLYIISKLNVCGVLLGTIGGFGTFLAYTISPMIRCYERISIYLVFFSLYAFFWLCQTYLTRISSKHQNSIVWLFASVLLVTGIFNQTSASYKFSNTTFLTTLALYKNDKSFIHQIEKILPSESMIFQLPYTPFPESGPVVQIPDYEHFKPYLHSHHLKWSYGAMKGRAVDKWQRSVSSLAVPQMLHDVIHAGYVGIYINRSGYKDQGYEIENAIANIIGQKPLVSQNNNLSFFDLRNYIKHLKYHFISR